MDLLKEIKDKIKASASSEEARGLDSVLAHIEIAERYHLRAKNERDEHLYTDVIYRTNHAFEGILKEAYVTLAGKPAEKLSPYEIEDYLLTSEVLKGRVVDLLTNYRQHWRNPSTHDYKLFFSEQESFLAIVSVSAFVSILLDQILEKLAFLQKSKELENAVTLARERVKDFDKLLPIEKVRKILESYARHYIANFLEIHAQNKKTTNAQLAAFVCKVAPDLKVELDVEIEKPKQLAVFDLVVKDGDCKIAVETRQSEVRDDYMYWLDHDAVVNQLITELYASGLKNGIVFFYPRKSTDGVVTTTASSGWPSDLNLRVISSADPTEFEDDDIEEPVELVDESA